MFLHQEPVFEGFPAVRADRVIHLVYIQVVVLQAGEVLEGLEAQLARHRLRGAVDQPEVLLQSSLVLVFSRANLADPHIHLVSRILVAPQVFLLLKSSLITTCLSIIPFVFAIYSEITGFIELWGLIALS